MSEVIPKLAGDTEAKGNVWAVFPPVSSRELGPADTLTVCL